MSIFNIGTNNGNTETSGATRNDNLYDPDREYLQRLMAYEMYGPQGVTGWDFNYTSPFQTGYAAGPHWDYAANGGDMPPDYFYAPTGGFGTSDQYPNSWYDTGDGGPSRPGTRVINDRNAARGNNTTTYGYGGQTDYNRNSRPIRGQRGGTTGGASAPQSGDYQTIGGIYGASNIPPDPNPTDGGDPGDQTPNPLVNDPQNPMPPGPPNSGNGPGTMPNATPGAPGGQNTAPVYRNPLIVGGGNHIGPEIQAGNHNFGPRYSSFSDWGQGGASGNAQLASGTLWNSFSDMVRNPDLSPEVRDAITVNANQAANAQFDSANNNLQRYGRTTGNRAGNAAATAQLAMDRATTAADINRNNEIDFEQLRRQRQAQGLQGISGLYQGENQRLAQLFGARGALSNNPVGRTNTTRGTGNWFGSNFGLGI